MALTNGKCIMSADLLCETWVLIDHSACLVGCCNCWLLLLQDYQILL